MEQPNSTESGQDKKDTVSYPLFEITRKMLLAGIGAISLSKDEIEEFIIKLVDRGEIAEKDGRKLISEVVEKRKRNLHDAEGEFNKHFQGVLERLNIPTKKEIDDLGNKIAALNQKIDELTKNNTK